MARILKIGLMNRFTKQIIAIISLTLLGCLYLQHVSDFQQQSRILEPCKPRSNIVFIKAHKCASSAIQNIFMRYGYLNNKIFVLPQSGNYLGHPTTFRRTMVPDPILFGSEYNILTHHSRMDYDEMSQLMPKDTLYITIIRKPVNLFESMYHYYDELAKTWGIPFENFSIPNSHIPKKVKEVRYVGRIGINQMMFDLGFPVKDFENTTKIKNYIQKLDSIFSLVMVAERMQESLILLKKLLCWDYDDIVVFKVNARRHGLKHFVNKTGIERINHLNKADHLLYQHFSKKLDKEVKKFGKGRMKREIELLNNRTKAYYDLCVNKTVSNKKVVRFVTKKTDNVMCRFLTQSEITLTNFLRKEQIKKYPYSVFQKMAAS